MPSFLKWNLIILHSNKLSDEFKIEHSTNIAFEQSTKLVQLKNERKTRNPFAKSIKTVEKLNVKKNSDYDLNYAENYMTIKSRLSSKRQCRPFIYIRDEKRAHL